MFTTSDRTRRVIRALATASLLALPLSGSITAAAAAEAPTALAPGDPAEPGAPTVRIDVPDPRPNEAWYDHTVEVEIVGLAGLSPVENITWATTGAQPGGASVAGSRVTVQIAAQGTTRLSATASDADGYISAEAHVVIKIDRTPPTIDVTAPSVPGAHRFGSPIFIDYVCADPESGIDRTNIDQCGVRFLLNGVVQGWAQTNDTWMPREEGLYEIVAFASNNAGLDTEISLGMLLVIANETEVPEFTIGTSSTPTSGWYHEPTTVGMSATDAGAGVSYIEYRTGDPDNWSGWTRVDAATAQTQFTTSGTHHVQARAVDYFGNASVMTDRAFALDLDAPALDLDGPADGVTVDRGDRLAIDYSCTDALSGIADCHGLVASGDTLDTSEAGTFSWWVLATDVAGNVTRVDRTYTVVIPDTQAPEVGVTAPTVPASGWYTSSPSIVLTASDPAGVAELRWTMTNPFGGQSSGTSTGTATFDTFMDGSSTISYSAIDSLGNEGPLETLQVRVDRNAPWIDIDSPASHPSLTADDRIVAGTRVAFEFRCDDAASGIASCESSVGDALPTNAVGTHVVTVTAIDRAGHQHVETLEYTVIAAPAPAPNPAPGNGGVAGSADRLPSTGAEPAELMLMALALLLIGGLAAVGATVARHRTRTR